MPKACLLRGVQATPQSMLTRSSKACLQGTSPFLSSTAAQGFLQETCLDFYPDERPFSRAKISSVLLGGQANSVGYLLNLVSWHKFSSAQSKAINSKESTIKIPPNYLHKDVSAQALYVSLVVILKQCQARYPNPHTRCRLSFQQEASVAR